MSFWFGTYSYSRDLLFRVLLLFYLNSTIPSLLQKMMMMFLSLIMLIIFFFFFFFTFLQYLNYGTVSPHSFFPRLPHMSFRAYSYLRDLLFRVLDLFYFFIRTQPSLVCFKMCSNSGIMHLPLTYSYALTRAKFLVLQLVCQYIIFVLPLHKYICFPNLFLIIAVWKLSLQVVSY